MRRTFIAALVAAAAFAALASAGEEPTKYDIDWVPRWKVGQTVTVTEHQVADSDMTKDGEPFRSKHDTFDATYVVRCDEAAPNGASSKGTLFVKSWKRTSGAVTDESLTGLRIAVDGKTWTLPEGKTAGPLAKKWLDKKLAKDDESPFSKLAPPKMAVGETWKPDSKAAAEALSKSTEAPFDLSAVEMEVKLVSVDGKPPDASGKFEQKFHIPIAGKVRGVPPNTVVVPGAAADAVVERSGPLTTSAMLGTERMTMTIAMDLEINEQETRVVIASKSKSLQEKTTVAGGEIPEPAKPDAEKPPAPAPATDPK